LSTFRGSIVRKLAYRITSMQ